MNAIVACESQYQVAVQSRHRYSFSDPSKGIYKGDREQSFGLVQIHLPAHPHVTYEQAVDPDFALRFLAKNLQQGQGRMWTCYREIAMNY